MLFLATGRFKITILYFDTWAGCLTQCTLHFCMYAFSSWSVCSVILSSASNGWCCRSVPMAYGCRYHSLCFLLVCLDCQRGFYWDRKAIKGYLVPFHVNFIHCLIIKEILLHKERRDTENNKDTEGLPKRKIDSLKQ